MSNPTELPDLDKLEALAKAAQISILRMGMNGRPNDYFALMNAMSPESVLALIALSRRAALANQLALTVPAGDARDAARYRVLRSHVEPRSVSISMLAPFESIPADQSIEQRIDMLCDQLVDSAALAHQPVQEQAKPEGEAPQADLRASVKAITRLLTDREWADVPLGDPDAVALFDAVDALVSANNEARAPAATLPPLCGAQHAESGKGGQPVWIVNDDRGEHVMMCPQKPAAEDMENLAAKIERNVIVLPFVLYPAAQQAAAPGAMPVCSPNCFYGDCPPCVEAGVAPSAPGTPEAPKPAHGHRDDYYLLANGRRLGLESISRVRNMPNWVLAMELFATGSTSAHQICHDAGIDPDSTTIQRAAAPKGGV